MSRGYRDGDSRRYFDWLYYANLDLLAAKNLQCDERCYNGAAFHCQQCIEKALKGYLLFKKHRLYDGHNLTWLCKQAMQIDGHFSKWLEKSALLNHYYIETRYPADIPFDIDTDAVMELIHSSSEMLSFITEIIHFDFRSYRKK